MIAANSESLFNRKVLAQICSMIFRMFDNLGKLTDQDDGGHDRVQIGEYIAESLVAHQYISADVAKSCRCSPEDQGEHGQYQFRADFGAV